MYLGGLHHPGRGVRQHLGGSEQLLLHLRVGVRLRLTLERVHQLGRRLRQDARLPHHLGRVAHVVEKLVCRREDRFDRSLTLKKRQQCEV